MATTIPSATLEKFATFGDMLRFLRRREGITQIELAIAVGYSDAQISRLEQNLRLPDIFTVEARFISALGLEDDPKATARLLELAANIRREDAPVFGLCPYKGLNYFDENDSDLFVGREALTSRLTERVLSLASRSERSGCRLLAIIGASGSGKSSLVRAGLISSLRWKQEAADWRIHVLTPTARPLESLAAELTRGSSLTAMASLLDDFTHEPRTLHLFARQSGSAGSASRLLLMIDQFEEVFSLCRSEPERIAFIDNLIEAASEADGPTVVVLALRADFYAHCAAYPGLRQALADHQEYIGAMDPDELRRAIEEPARRSRWEFELGLVDLLLHDVGHEPGSLPLLSHALLETWHRRRGQTMTLGGYSASGGVRGAIAETAEAVFADQFTREQQAIARRVFLRLTELGDDAGTGDTRRRATFDELILKSGAADATQAVLQALADARLIVMAQNTAEVAHEALIREWPTLRGWLEEDRDGLRLHRQLSEAAHQWVALDHEREALYRGARLTQAREWAAVSADEINPLERQFLAASVDAADRESAEREAQRQHELEAARKLAQAERAHAEVQIQAASRLKSRNRVLRAVGAVALVLAILASLFGVQARRNLSIAQSNLAHAESLRLAAEASVILAQGGDPQTAALLSIRALQSNYSPQADAALSAALSNLYNRQILLGHTGWIYSLEFSSNGKYVLTGSQDGTARLWDIRAGKELRRFLGHKGGISSVAFSPDGQYVLTGGNDGTVRIWDAETVQQIRMMTSQGGVSSVSYSPDGRFVLSASDEDTAQLWDAASGRAIRTFAGHTALVTRAVFSPDGRYVLTGSFDNSARLWDVDTGETIRTFSSPDTGFSKGHVTTVAYAPDGRYVLSGSDDRTAKLWDATSGAQVCTFNGHTGAVIAVAFSPDGKYVATASEDKTARVWFVPGCQELRQYTGPEAGLKSIAFSPDGGSILAGGEDNTARLWAAPARAPLRIYEGAAHGPKVLLYSLKGDLESRPPGVTSVAFSPDGNFVLTGGQDGSTRIWDTQTGMLIRAMTPDTKGISSVAYSPDGKYVLTGGEDHVIRLRSVETGQQLRSMNAGVGGVASVAFSPDGKYLLTQGASPIITIVGRASGQTTVWDISTGKEVAGFDIGPGPNESIGSRLVAFAPDGGKILAANGTDAELVDIASGHELCTFSGHLSLIYGVAFSPDGRLALTGSLDKTARLWDVRTCRQLRLFTDHRSEISSVAFSPDGVEILTGHADDTAHVWDAFTGEDLRQFSGHTSWINSVAFSPDGRFVLTGSQDGTARLWDTDYHDSIRFACSLLWRDLTGQERTQYNIADDGPTCR